MRINRDAPSLHEPQRATVKRNHPGADEQGKRRRRKYELRFSWLLHCHSAEGNGAGAQQAAGREASYMPQHVDSLALDAQKCQ